MSTGADCTFEQRRDAVGVRWYYRIQEWPYGDNPDYQEHGPFDLFSEAEEHLQSNYANPGGYNIEYLSDYICPHDITERSHNYFHHHIKGQGWVGAEGLGCLRCGGFKADGEEWQTDADAEDEEDDEDD